MLKISDFNYNLPDERIAKFPVAQRDQSKLLVYNKGNISEDQFFNIIDYLPEGALMVFNNTRVIRARLHFRKETGALIEIFLLEPYAPADYEQMFQTRGKCQWHCLIGNKKKWKEGALTQTLTNTDGTQTVLTAQINHEAQTTSSVIEFSWNSDLSFAEIVDMAGELPIPPYLNRQTEQSDLKTYQTVYSKIKGSVAAPTAGLHFTPEVLKRIDDKGIMREEVTLHVGAGTFKPVKTEDVADHEMHAEHFAVKLSTIQSLLRHEGKAIAVGTTSVRTLESLYYIGEQIIAGVQPDEDGEFHVSQWEPYGNQPSSDFSSAKEQNPNQKSSPIEALKAIEHYLLSNGLNTLHASTQIIITPAGYNYKIVKVLVTNFHQPQSTLLLLVSALIGDNWHKVYDYALAHDFRFLSYGDSSLLIP
ncbi:MAG: S-adenosylmethionine:tRNA ribosyltransferase-isomerase [Bacteroidaceae bacterium]|nr:S-adenosylmethionine:tRNA ribosyltransferase-isomerase [Bacteroidaceae bacterium]